MAERKRGALERFTEPGPELEPVAEAVRPLGDVEEKPCERPAAGHIDECPAVLADRAAWCGPCRARADRQDG